MFKCARVPGSLGRLIIMLAAGLLATTAHAQSCTPLPSGILSWWRAEGNATDSIGTNNGTISGGVSYTNGEAGQGFWFSTTNGSVRIPKSPSLNAGTNSGFTVEAWINPTNVANHNPVVEWNSGGYYRTFLSVQTVSGPGTLYANLIDTPGGYYHVITSPAGTIVNGQYQHVALTYDGGSGVATLYCNGAVVAQTTFAPFVPDTSKDVYIGRQPASAFPNDTWSFGGVIDEVSLYSRALTQAEIQTIYNAGAAGKCFSSIPTITTQPSSQSVGFGGDVIFSAAASGPIPLTYQWWNDSGSIAGAINSTLVLSNVQLNASGNYYVVASNPYGSTNSSMATLTVIPPPPAVPAPAGLVDWWRAESNALDSVGTNNGTLQGTASFAPGKVGWGFAFDGSGYVSIPDSPTLDGFSRNITIELWMRSGALGNSPTLVSNSSWRVGSYLGDNTISVVFNGANPPNLYGVTPVNDGRWHHVAATYDGSTMALYVDGALEASHAATGAIRQNNAPLEIGNSFSGRIDEVSLYGRALSADEVGAIYNAGAGGKIVAPQPPCILIEPSSATVLADENASLSSMAGGSPPITYQWFHDGNSIDGATNVTLSLSNLQASDGGGYYVVASNPYGSTNSSTATLAVVTAPTPTNCTPTPGGLVAWWRAEGDATDIVGTNNGTISGGVTYATGEVGQAFSFDGSTSSISVPPSSNLDVGAGDGLTIECWIWPSQAGPIAEWETGSLLGPMLWVQSQGVLYANLRDINGNDHVIQSAPGAISSNGWQHVALTYDLSSGNSYLYVNGVQVTNANFGNIRPATYPPLSMYLGYRANYVYGGRYSRYGGLLDELGVYNRALCPVEIQAVYNAGSAGKCYGPVPPSVVVAPTNETVAEGGRARFSVAAAGYPALSYQWFNNGVSISGATDRVFNLDNVQFSDAGSYYVVVSNAWGWTNSEPATLSVTNPPPTPNCTPAPAGLISWWPAEGNATDFVGTNNGILLGGLSFTNGEVGQGFWFNNTGQGVRVPSSQSLTLPQSYYPPASEILSFFTFECWINPTDVSQPHTIFDWPGFELSIESGGSLTARMQNYNVYNDGQLIIPVTNIVSGGTGLVVTNTFQHVAMVLIKELNPNAGGGLNGTVYLYYNGVQVGSMSQSVPSRVYGYWLTAASGDFHLGYSPARGIDFAGILDEASLYGTNLTSNQIAAIYNAGPGGKCALPPSILREPTNASAPIGRSTNFSVSAIGIGTLTYQWFKDSNSINGATGPTLSLTNLQAGDSGGYYVAVSNPFGTTNSSTATLTVTNPAPVVITLQPTNEAVPSGGNAIFDVAVSGTPPFTYQWYKNGYIITGETNQWLSLNNLQFSDSAQFYVVVSNQYSWAVSSTVALTVSGPPPVITQQPVNEVVPPGGTATFTVSASDTGPLTYQWQCNGTNISPGIIRTVVGNGTAGYSGDGGPATNAQLSGPWDVTVDSRGRLFIADRGNLRVRMVDTNGIITTVAGEGMVGVSGSSSGLATNSPLGDGIIRLATDNAGNFYMTEQAYGYIWKVDANGLMTTLGSVYMYEPLGGLCLDGSGNIFFADIGSSMLKTADRILKLNTNGVVSTVAGGGPNGYPGVGGPAINALLVEPNDVTMDSAGELFIAESNMVCKVDTQGILSSVASTGFYPKSVKVDAAGNVFIMSGFFTSQVYEVMAVNGVMTPVVGNGTQGYTGDGVPATSAELNSANGMVLDSAGNLFIADNQNNRVREVSGIPPYPVNQPTFLIANASGSNNGNYSVVITGPGGSVTSSVVSLTIALPPVINSTAENPDGSFSLNLSTTPNASSRILVATDLCPPIVWQPIYTNTSGGAWQFIDTNTGGMGSKYYRLSTP